MGLYNMVFQTPSEEMLAATLLLAGHVKAPARFRDAWFELVDDQMIVAVYTRLGGGNRPDYADEWARLRAMPTYLRDADDTFDSTYATIRFRIVEDLWEEIDDGIKGEVLRQADRGERDMDARWKAALDALDDR